MSQYLLPIGTIKQKETTKGIEYKAKLNNKCLDFIEDGSSLSYETGKPTSFYIEDDKICFYPVPDDVYNVKIDYYTLSVGFDKDDEPIYKLKYSSEV